MRHHDHNKRKFSRKSGPRRAFLRSLAEALLVRGKIETSEARAKALRSFVEPLITIGRAGTIASRRELASRLGTAARAALVMKVAPKYTDRTGGYTRIVKMLPRLSDASPRAQIELI